MERDERKESQCFDIVRNPPENNLGVSNFSRGASAIVNKKELLKWKHRKGRKINLKWRWEVGNPRHRTTMFSVTFILNHTL